ncbi:MAG: hypothetical protein K8I03_12785 [Ignavibacteria bacterium]|nr:hypothetical protein [Ignavibacteria bacterium]
MKRLRNNTIRIIMAALLLVMGNFSVALAHIDCKIGDSSHSKCEMECCQEGACCSEEENEHAVEIKDESGSCCEVHIEKSMEQDITMPVITFGTEKNNLDFLVLTLRPEILASQFFPVIVHKLKTTNIFLAVSNLRI